MKPENPSRRSKAEIATAATAIGAIGTLVGLSVTGILTSLPLWAATLIVVTELLAPVLVFVLLKRGNGDG